MAAALALVAVSALAGCGISLSRDGVAIYDSPVVVQVTNAAEEQGLFSDYVHVWATVTNRSSQPFTFTFGDLSVCDDRGTCAPGQPTTDIDDQQAVAPGYGLQIEAVFPWSAGDLPDELYWTLDGASGKAAVSPSPAQ